MNIIEKSREVLKYRNFSPPRSHPPSLILLLGWGANELIMEINYFNITQCRLHIILAFISYVYRDLFSSLSPPLRYPSGLCSYGNLFQGLIVTVCGWFVHSSQLTRTEIGYCIVVIVAKFIVAIMAPLPIITSWPVGEPAPM